MSKKQSPRAAETARKKVQHELHLDALRSGVRHRATTFTDRRKEAARRACRNRSGWQS